ncbi:MAG: hypothetical protein RMJ56_17250 [Gemmataceae bacterium]|nr:hypothetical protein [Gemmata sp.]MDW8199343.1 hypothetical protein [Gemmataceae bacterium]
MISPIGLEPWEVMVMAGIFAVSALACGSCLGATLAWIIFRERKVAQARVVSPVVPTPPAAATSSGKPQLASAGA